MAYSRENTGRWAWLKSVGSSSDPLEDDWPEKRPYLLDSVWFPKHPRSIRRGDLLVYYAASRGMLPAVVEVLSDEVHEDYDHPRYSERWPWRMTVKPLLLVPRLPDAPPLSAIGVDPLRVRRQSHILLRPDELAAARCAFMPLIDGEAAIREGAP